MSSTDKYFVRVGAFNETLIDDVVKGIVEGMIFIIPENPEMPKNNNQINVNGFTASLLKSGENIGCVKRVRDVGTKDVVVKVNLDVGNQTIEPNKSCSLKFFVYDFSAIIDSNDMKVFGTPSKSIMEFIDNATIDIKHRCYGKGSMVGQSYTCSCVSKLNGCVIECTQIIHTITKDLLIDLVQNNLYDMRSLSCVPYTKHGSLVSAVINDPKIIHQIKETVEDSDKNPDIVFVDPQAIDFVLSL